MNDFNGGIFPNGLFWTVQLPSDAFSLSDRQAKLRVVDVPVIDSFQFAGPNVVPATVDIEVAWRTVGPPEGLGSGTGVPETDPAAFLGRFAPARAIAKFSGSELGFRFRSNPGASSDAG